ncbi:Rho-GTPase-activating protein 8 [Oleoguttula sp. CCFEE 5521]
MSTFATSFWSADYAGGLGVLFGKLQQGVQENQQIITVARLRAEAEDLYSQKLGDIDTATNRIEGGFQKDDGASVKKAFDGVRGEMIEASRNHRKIASNIRELVLNPFSRWCDQHAARIQNSQDDLQGRIRAHDRQAETVRQYRSAYFNKCRRVEDLDEEEKLAFQDPMSTAATGSPKTGPVVVPSIKVEDEEDEPEPLDIGDETYQPEQVKKILTHMVNNIRVGETKVPILGTYQNTSSGADITEYIQKHLGGTTLLYAERIGQDLLGHGFLRLVGNVGSTFANSSKMNYQWRPKVFQITGIPEKKPKLLGRTTTLASHGSDSTPDSPVVGAMNEYLGGWNPLNNAHANETPVEKLEREAKVADERYKQAVRKLDTLRCSLEEAMIDHLKFMERCELDRLKAIKSVVLDFSGSISNVIPSLQSTVDNMMLYQETVQPLGDLRYFLENYRTGSYIPKVTVYENYYNTVDEQTFGVDIEARARSDRKRVPLIITTILTFLDSRYPELEGDAARRSIWVVDVPLAAIHHLRNQLNTGKPVPPGLLEKYEIPIVAAVLKLYFLELPDSLVSSHVYEIVKTIYATTAQTASEAARIQVLQSTLGQLRLANIATLDAVVTHFSRLIELTSADEAYITQLATTLAPCILRPKQETGLSMAEKYSIRLLKDLVAHKEAIFGELKRQATNLHHAPSTATRPARGISTDESKRREHMEERQRAIAAATQAQSQSGSNRSRQPSPGPGARIATPSEVLPGHRRDRSRGPETRFPILTASVISPTDRRVLSPTSAGSRGSLEVPGSPPSTRTVQPVTAPAPPSKDTPPSSSGSASPPRTNGASLHQPPPAEPAADEHSTGPAARRLSALPTMSASISSPGDFMTPSHYYAGSVDSSTTASTAPSASTAPTSTAANSNRDSASSGIKAPTSKYKITNDTSERPASPATSVDSSAPVKRDSLTRSAGAAAGGRTFPVRKGTASSLQRASLISKRDSGESGTGEYVASPVDAPEESAGRGVQLQDREMDFD